MKYFYSFFFFEEVKSIFKKAECYDGNHGQKKVLKTGPESLKIYYYH